MLGRFLVGLIVIVFDMIAQLICGLFMLIGHVVGWEIIAVVVVGLFVLWHYSFI